MEILLLEDINGIGKKNDLLVVGDGFALNFLLPQRKALVATPTVRKRYAEHIKRRAEEKLHEKEVQAGASAALTGKMVTFKRKATKTGKLYAGISEEQIAEALKEQHTITVPVNTITIPTPIKAVGTFDIRVRIGEAEQPVKVTVTAEA
ncbi:MAG: 50S ribosomal protein L9 [Candidatus Peregrinibacteria bacterium]|nr:50S ribosomal protein L9 [Candidatus Peregrinibacteria bacterium]